MPKYTYLSSPTETFSYDAPDRRTALAMFRLKRPDASLHELAKWMYIGELGLGANVNWAYNTVELLTIAEKNDAQV